MKSLKELIGTFKGNEKDLGEKCVGELISKGYTFNPVYGWEKVEVLKRFNLNPDMTGVPCVEVDDLERETSYEDEKDEFTGRKTGRKISRLKEKTTGRKVWVPTMDWLNYLDYKKQQDKINIGSDEILEAMQL